MSWLAPWYLLGVLAVAGPVIFHLWRQTPQGRRAFSTLLFLTPSPPRITRRSRIEHWFLLLLRGAAVAVLAAAFARPVWRASATIPAATDEGEYLAVLVDVSSSLRRTGLWQQAVKRAGERLSQAPASTDVGLFAYAAHWRAVAGFAELEALTPSARRDVVAARLRELEPSWGGSRLGEALVRTTQALQEAQAARLAPRRLRICLVTDLQAGSDLAALRAFDWPEDIVVELVLVAPDSPTNAGLQLVAPAADAADDQQRVRITNAAESRASQFSLRWDGGQEQQPFQTVYVPPGQSRVLALPTAPSDTAAVVRLEGDDQPFDNRVWLPQREPPRCSVLFCGTDAAQDPAGLRYFLERALAANPRVQAQVWSADQSAPSGAAPPPALIVAAEADAPGVELLAADAPSRREVLLVPKTAADAARLLERCGVSGAQASEATVPDYALLADIDFESPLFAPFAESQFADFTGVHFWKHRKLEWGADVAAEIVARFDDGDPALVAFRRGEQRIWCLTSGWHPTDSQWARSSKFVPWLWRLLELALGSDAQALAVAVGEPLPLQSAEFPDPQVILPGGAAPESVSPAETTAPGHYTLVSGERRRLVAVNLPPEESRTDPLPPEQLETLGVQLSTRAEPARAHPSPERLRQQQLAELEQQQQWWRWGLLTALAVLMLETCLGGWWDARRRRAGLAETQLAAHGSRADA